MPNNHRFRKNIRLSSYDYASNGFYFITICCDQLKPIFGKVVNDAMILNDLGIIANNQWQNLAERYPQITCHSHQIMPNHMHGILEIHNNSLSNIPIGNIIGAYKSLTHKYCRELPHITHLGKLWQPNFYEHVIRDDRAFEKITEYIQTNPAQWTKDSYFIK